MNRATLEHQEPRLAWSSFRLLPPLIWIPLIAVLLASVAVTALSEWSARRARESGERVAEVLHRLEALADLKAHIVAIDAGQRGYLLTHDPTYLEPFAESVRSLPQAEQAVRELVAGLPDSQTRLERLNRLIVDRVDDATQVIETFSSGRAEEAMALVRTDTGRQLSERFRAEVAALESLSQTELYRLQEQQASGAFWSRVGLLVMTLVSLGLLLIVSRLFMEEAVRQEMRRSAAEHEAREFEKLVEVRTRELSELSTHLQKFAEKEKSDLARNLHDELGGLLTAAKMDLSWLQGRLDQPHIQQRLMQLGSVLDEAMDLKRRVVEDLRPSLLDHFGLPTALRAYLESACAKAGLKFELTVSEEAESMPKEIAIALFRVVQEGLTNVIRHAEARQVRLELSSDSKSFILLLSDDGRGIDLTSPSFRWSHGLTGMRHRVKALGGRFSVESSPGKGTTLRVEVPRTAGDSIAA